MSEKEEKADSLRKFLTYFFYFFFFFDTAIALSAQIPSVHQGYGRVQLSPYLDLANSPVTPFFDLFVDDSRTLQTSENYTFCFSVRTTYTNDTTQVPFKCTLVWMDAPSLGTSALALVNDLDLVVTSSEGEIFFGNSIKANNGKDALYEIPDRLNNVEQVTITPPLYTEPNGGIVHYTVHVIGRNVPKGPQPFALVVTGNVAHEDNVTACACKCCLHFYCFLFEFCSVLLVCFAFLLFFFFS